MKVTELSDYSTLKKLAAALWQKNSSYHGAAVMVGAGFSRSAAKTGDAEKKLPLWNDISTILAEDLGGNKNSDPLRLAEEYCAYFGKQALYDLLKRSINDTAWEPSELHSSLLDLPWADVLTTNWDTLLERASLETRSSVYSIVNRQEDLSSALSPRIVKLHGTINITENLIFTQEDYRRYPQDHAAFVNLARQIFIENELCLLGFSGEDPNFLQWAGWVRDHLASHARRIYLVGALNLTESKRKYLESINVAPIDLWPLVSHHDNHDTKHFHATKEFISELTKLKPKQAWEWSPTSLVRTSISAEELEKTRSDSSYGARLLENKLARLEADRNSYPGWLVCPTKQRWRLASQISDPFPSTNTLSEMSQDGRAKLLYEIAWRDNITLSHTPLWLAREFYKVCDPSIPRAITKKQQLEIALSILKNSRHSGSHEYGDLGRKAEAILESNQAYWPEAENELTYYRAILARDKFDFHMLEEITNKINESDSTWKLRKASLLAETGQFSEGRALVLAAHRELNKQHRKNQNSIYLFSRLAWAHWIKRGIELWSSAVEFQAFPSIYQDSKCCPWDYIEHLQNEISKELENQREQQSIEPLFEPGSYRDNSKKIRIINNSQPYLLLDNISNDVGMPLRWSGVSFLTQEASRISELDQVRNTDRFTLAIRSASNDESAPLKKFFSRTKIALLPQPDVDHIIDCCIRSINYWEKQISSKNGHAVERLRIFIEALARTSVRASPELAKNIFLLACNLTNNSELHHIWLVDPLRHLVEYSLSSIPSDKKFEVLSQALAVPLESEISLDSHKEWPNPKIDSPGPRPEDKEIDNRILEIIKNITPSSQRGSAALLRLLPLVKSGFLRDPEKELISTHIWGSPQDYSIIPATGLLAHALLELPCENPSAARSLLIRHLFAEKSHELPHRSILLEIACAARSEKQKILPKPSQAKSLFSKLTEWRGRGDRDPLGFDESEDNQTGELIAEVLAHSVTPMLPKSFLTESNYKKLSTFVSETKASEATIALTYFAIANTDYSERVERAIQQALQDREPNTVAYGSYSILKWRELKSTPHTKRLTSRLVHLITSGRLTGLPAILWTVEQLYKKGFLSQTETDSLSEALPTTFDNAHYSNFPPESRESVSLSLVRSSCVKLARTITENSKNEIIGLNRILEESILDELPEVRFS